MQSWTDDVWTPRNIEWIRVWRGGTYEETEILSYRQDFVRSPEILLKDKSTLLITLYVRRPSRQWKDWLVLRLMPDLREEFVEVKHGKVVYIAERQS
jgi:hypothetical protein